MKEAIITAGGVKHPARWTLAPCESKKAPACSWRRCWTWTPTGGFNLQIAWCTGRAAGEGAAQYCKEETH
ncbi:MAG: hypothetical protein ACLUNZ_14020 [Evtepia sp.]